MPYDSTPLEQRVATNTAATGSAAGVRTAESRALASAPKPTADAPRWLLSVEEGAHRGIGIPLNTPRLLLGSELGGDVVLADAGVAPRHCLFIQRGNSLAVQALGGHVIVGKRRVAPGATCRLSSGARVALGSTVLVVHGPEAQGGRHVRFKLAATCLLAVTVGVGVLVGTAPERAALSPAPAAPAQQAASAAAAAAAVDLRQRLLEVGIDKGVTVTAGGGAVTAAGSLLPDVMANWRDVGRWFDGHTAGAVPLIDRVRASAAAAEDAPRVVIRGVSIGAGDPDVSYIITNNGERLVEGSVIDDGWVVDKIEADKVMLRRGTQSFVVHL